MPEIVKPIDDKHLSLDGLSASPIPATSALPYRNQIDILNSRFSRTCSPYCDPNQSQNGITDSNLQLKVDPTTVDCDSTNDVNSSSFDQCLPGQNDTASAPVQPKESVLRNSVDPFATSASLPDSTRSVEADHASSDNVDLCYSDKLPVNPLTVEQVSPNVSFSAVVVNSAEHTALAPQQFPLSQTKSNHPEVVQLQCNDATELSSNMSINGLFPINPQNHGIDLQNCSTQRWLYRHANPLANLNSCQPASLDEEIRSNTLGDTETVNGCHQTGIQSLNSSPSSNFGFPILPERDKSVYSTHSVNPLSPYQYTLTVPRNDNSTRSIQYSQPLDVSAASQFYKNPNCQRESYERLDAASASNRGYTTYSIPPPQRAPSVFEGRPYVNGYTIGTSQHSQPTFQTPNIPSSNSLNSPCSQTIDPSDLMLFLMLSGNAVRDGSLTDDPSGQNIFNSNASHLGPSPYHNGAYSSTVVSTNTSPNRYLNIPQVASNQMYYGSDCCNSTNSFNYNNQATEMLNALVAVAASEKCQNICAEIMNNAQLPSNNSKFPVEIQSQSQFVDNNQYANYSDPVRHHANRQMCYSTDRSSNVDRSIGQQSDYWFVNNGYYTPTAFNNTNHKYSDCLAERYATQQRPPSTESAYDMSSLSDSLGDWLTPSNPPPPSSPHNALLNNYGNGMNKISFSPPSSYYTGIANYVNYLSDNANVDKFQCGLSPENNDMLSSFNMDAALCDQRTFLNGTGSAVVSTSPYAVQNQAETSAHLPQMNITSSKSHLRYMCPSINNNNNNHSYSPYYNRAVSTSQNPFAMGVSNFFPPYYTQRPVVRMPAGSASTSVTAPGAINATDVATNGNAFPSDACYNDPCCVDSTAIKHLNSPVDASNLLFNDPCGMTSFNATQSLSLLPSTILRNVSRHGSLHEESYSRKVFVGGLPPDIDEEGIVHHFRRFGLLIVDWPHKNESKSYFPPKGYAFLIYSDERSVQDLMEACVLEDQKLYMCVSSPSIKDKPVQIRPWLLSDSDYVMDGSQPLDPRKTIFVGGVPRPLRAVELALIMNRMYGGVCYAGIDTDPELKYPKGAGRVAFSNQQSYIAAISARFMQLTHCEIDKRVEVKPYVLDDQMCDECQGTRCNGKFAPFFCANVSCLQYYCENCWTAIHCRAGREFHKPLVKEGADRPRSFLYRWS